MCDPHRSPRCCFSPLTTTPPTPTRRQHSTYRKDHKRSFPTRLMVAHKPYALNFWGSLLWSYSHYDVPECRCGCFFSKLSSKMEFIVCVDRQVGIYNVWSPSSEGSRMFLLMWTEKWRTASRVRCRSTMMRFVSGRVYCYGDRQYFIWYN